jgi:hypothetical protein
MKKPRDGDSVTEDELWKIDDACVRQKSDRGCYKAIEGQSFIPRSMLLPPCVQCFVHGRYGNATMVSRNGTVVSLKMRDAKHSALSLAHISSLKIIMLSDNGDFATCFSQKTKCMSRALEAAKSPRLCSPGQIERGGDIAQSIFIARQPQLPFQVDAARHG